MSNTGHAAKQKTDMQTERTALLAAATTHAAAGLNSVAAYEATRAQDLKDCHDRENAPSKLT